MAIDPSEKYIVAASDFGHLFIHCIDGVETDSRTLQSEYAPFNSLHFSTVHGTSLVFWY